MRRWLFLPLAAALCGCVAYPSVYWTTKEGTARLDDDGKPILIKAAVLKECQSVDGETQTTVMTRQAMTDDKGHYRIPLRGLTWRSKNLVTLAECDTHVQMFVCRSVCKEADDIDINVLGK